MGLLQTLLVHPPIFDFTAYDFWLRPYGMMRAAARLAHACRFTFFDYLTAEKKDSWGRGRIEGKIVKKPEEFNDIPRRFRRFGRPRAEFQELLRSRAFDVVLIQTSMTYWYPGIREVIEDVRTLQPAAKIVLGGVYATLCTEHAALLGADIIIQGANLAPLYQLLAVEPARETGPGYIPEESKDAGILKLSDGCPFNCTYCAAPVMWKGFTPRSLDECVEDFRRLVATGAKDIAFYDDALLYRADEMLLPFLDAVSVVTDTASPVRFHTPNALNARFVTPDLARRMAGAGFASFFLGFESGSQAWQSATGGKISAGEFEAAVNYLREAGASAIFAYILAGHPDAEAQEPENSIRFAHRLGVRVMLSEFSPIPGTADGKKCAPWADLAEPLSHNKTAFAIRRLGFDQVNRLKNLARRANPDISWQYIQGASKNSRSKACG
jgi:radical SAM superfamily enzyme YgiQ (UPF0313 family)